MTHFLVKWCSLPYEDSTWELMEDVDNEAIRLYGIRTTPPIPSHCTVSSPNTIVMCSTLHIIVHNYNVLVGWLTVGKLLGKLM